jgi:hypothetical protein
VTVPYQARAEQHAVHRDAERRRSVQISRARLAVFLAAAGCLVWTLARGADPVRLTMAAGLFVVFGVLVFWHARVEDRAAWHDALRTVSLRGSARVERRWDDLPEAEAPGSIDLVHHAYALDLDLFGRASLFQWLGPAATPRGSIKLATWLLGSSAPDTVVARQAAVVELAPADEWREQLAAHGELARDARQSEIDAFLAWAEGPEPAVHVSLPFVRGGHATIFLFPIRMLVRALTASIWILLALFLLGFMDSALWLLPLLAGIVLSLALA